jgi:hypothetical protein
MVQMVCLKIILMISDELQLISQVDIEQAQNRRVRWLKSESQLLVAVELYQNQELLIFRP